MEEHCTKLTFFIFYREIETSSQALASLCNVIDQAKKVRDKCEHGSLIPSGDHKAIGLFNMSAAIDQNPFYGRCIGLHVSLQMCKFFDRFN